MFVYVSGGCKNGKSFFAQRVAKELAGDGPLYYIATMIPSDDEDRARIERHIKEREGWGFVTVEQPRSLETLLERVDTGGTFLLDSVTAVLANEMFAAPENAPGGADEGEGQRDMFAPRRVAGSLTRLAEGVKNIVMVSDYIYSDATIYDFTVEEYRKGLAFVDCFMASRADRVVEVAYGIAEDRK